MGEKAEVLEAVLKEAVDLVMDLCKKFESFALLICSICCSLLI